jgi:hypothetical protein
MNHRVPVAAKMIRLRFLVGALGERLTWWPSRFTDEIGLRRLAIPFPRTALRAALESVTVAARLDHDQKLNPATVHLFRLRGDQEDAVAHQLSGSTVLSPPPVKVDDILAGLDELGPPNGSVPSDGPCSLGRDLRTRLNAAVADMARVYAGAARAGLRSIPYFEVTE